MRREIQVADKDTLDEVKTIVDNLVSNGIGNRCVTILSLGSIVSITEDANVGELPYEFENGCAVVLNGEIHILGGGSAISTVNTKKAL